jgi:hypothetical protein
MQTRRRALLTVFSLMLIFNSSASVLYVDVNSPKPTSPFVDWATAATNIQDAIDVSVDGDLIQVTNGVYATGGRVMAGDLTNRVALDKALTVQSVNGPFATVILGAGATNGTSAVRCAWLTNGAALVGFTLQAGATRNSGDPSLTSGGGAWCASSNAIVANCLVVSNTAFYFGGGAYQGTLNNCLISSNGLTMSSSGAAHNSMLNSCTVVSNASYGVSSSGPNPATLTNCIVYYNTRGNYIGCVFSYCCTTPLPSGAGNFTNAPQLFLDEHLSSTSPCRGAGTNLVTGTDIFGQPWLNPPSVGCAEWQSAPMVGAPRLQLTSDPVGFTVKASSFAGQLPFTNYWIKDGIPLQDGGHFSSTQTTNLVAIGVSFADAGAYQLVVTNAYGAVTSSVAQLVVHCVDAAGTNPVTPYSSWANAATSIQDAISGALAGEVALVTNGIYATGGTSMDGVITNRVSVDRAIIVQSVNGPTATVIQGVWDPATKNGPGAVRCAWLTNNATLSGFTLFHGATCALSFPITQSMVGGGAWGSSTNATLFNCLIITNIASAQGGGVYQLSLNNSTLLANQCPGTGDPGGNQSGDGGGAYRSSLKNCVISQNFANNDGGGTAWSTVRNSIFTQNQVAYSLGSADYYGVLVNCTLFNNTYTSKTQTYGGAAAYSHLTNCIVYGNHVIALGAANYTSCTMSYCDSDPLPAGTGNIDADPQLLADGVHIAATSPCRGAGTSVASGTDLDGQPWAIPPSLGCDEWQPAPLVGGQPQIQLGGIPLSAIFGGLAVIGQSPYSYWWSKDGVLLEDSALFSSTHSTT